MLVLLDRDGVINTDLKPHGVTHLDQLEIYPFALEAIALLTKAGVKIAVVTNQSAIGKGLMDEATLATIHEAIQKQSIASGGKIDAFYFCPDHPDRPTKRRKPDDGMIQEALADFGVSAGHTPLIGDSLRDMQAAAKAGCPAYLVATGNGGHTYGQLEQHAISVTYCKNILDAAQRLIVDMAYGHP